VSLDHNQISSEIIASAIEVHRTMGPGMLEPVYEDCMIFELKSRNLKVEAQVKQPLVYKGSILNKHFFLDLLVEDKVVVELKSVEELLPVHEVQLVTYLKLTDKKLGLLINFNEPVLKLGIRRKINGEI
jgi:GxxExxY protein